MNASLWRRFWREPLTRFFAAGAGLFVVYALAGSRAPADDRRITIDEYELQALAALWQAQWRRPPTQDELTRLVVDRVREEVLYREALALDLDENDVLVRRRLAEKLEMALNDVAATAEPSADDLRRYFESHADRYVEPPGLTLTHRFFSRDRRGDSVEADARRRLEALVAGGTADDDSFHAAKTLELQDAGRLERIFGGAFRDAVLEHAAPAPVAPRVVRTRPVGVRDAPGAGGRLHGGAPEDAGRGARNGARRLAPRPRRRARVRALRRDARPVRGRRGAVRLDRRPGAAVRAAGRVSTDLTGDDCSDRARSPARLVDRPA